MTSAGVIQIGSAVLNVVRSKALESALLLSSNREAARQIDAHRVRLAKGEAGIIQPAQAPTLKEFSPRLESAFKTLCAERSVPHPFRHTYRTRLGETGADAFTTMIMRLMGHSTVTVSQRYVHPKTEAIENAVSRVSLSRESVEASASAVRMSAIGFVLAGAYTFLGVMFGALQQRPDVQARVAEIHLAQAERQQARAAFSYSMMMTRLLDTGMANK
jgi:hypothetical protein